MRGKLFNSGVSKFVLPESIQGVSKAARHMLRLAALIHTFRLHAQHQLGPWKRLARAQRRLASSPRFDHVSNLRHLHLPRLRWPHLMRTVRS